MVQLTKKEIELIEEAFSSMGGGLWYDCIEADEVDRLKSRSEVLQFIEEAPDLCRGDFVLLVTRLVELILKESGS